MSPDPNNPTAFAVLYQNEPVAFDLAGVVPNSHTRVTVRTAKVRLKRSCFDERRDTHAILLVSTSTSPTT